VNSSCAFYQQMARACLLTERVLVIRHVPAAAVAFFTGSQVDA